MIRYEVRRVKSHEIPAAMALIWQVYLEFDAPAEGGGAAEAFRQETTENPKFIRACRQGICPVYGAFDGEEIIGVMILRPDKTHICQAFVKKEYHRQGVGTAVFRYLLADRLRKNPGLQAITLNATPYGLPFYLHLGFTALSEEQEKNGVRFTPMRYDVQKNQNRKEVYTMSVKETFLDLISYPTNSDPATGVTPSTPGQKVLGAHIVDLMKEMGIEDAYMSDTGYVYGTIPATAEGRKTVGFIAHMDTYGGVKGEDIKPQVIENYDGGDIKLGESGLTLSPADFPSLKEQKGKTLITTDGTTLLGGDDKAGVAEILCAAREILLEKKPHGTVKLGFTPDEEIGQGADHFDVQGFGCDFAYTVDGGHLGELEYENFNAAAAVAEVSGLSIHTGSAKGKMVNSMEIAMEFVGMLPREQKPEYTEGYEGFIHLDGIQGDVEHTKMEFIIRDHDAALFEAKKKVMEGAAAYLNAKYPSKPVKLAITESYRNMKEQILPHWEVIETMEKAMRANGVEPFAIPIRGGTDGARLSYMGLPCPNICTGGANAHGKLEYVVAEDMEAIKDIIKTAVEIAE